MTCLINEGSPIRSGTAFGVAPDARTLDSEASAFHRLLAITCCVNLTSCARFGTSTRDTDPASSRTFLGLARASADMFAPSPLRAGTTMRLRRRSTARADGYHAVGIRPSNVELAETPCQSYTAIALLAPRLTPRRELGSIASPVGELPNGALKKGWMVMVLTTVRLRVSTTDTVSLFVLATNSVPLLKSIAVG